MQTQQVRVGLFGIGLEAYWTQFDGLEQRLCGYVEKVADRLKRPDVEVVNLGMVDTPEKAVEAGHRFRREDVDVIFLYVTTYALSATVLPVVRRAKVPVILLNLQPEAAIDYERFNRMGSRTEMTGEWLAYCSACPVPEIASVFQRSGIRFHQITGQLEGDPESEREMNEWLDAARAAFILEHNRMALMGHYYQGMLDIYTDTTRMGAVFGTHFEIVEVDELSALRRQVTPEDVREKILEFRAELDVRDDCPEAELERAARTSVALDHLVKARALTSMAYFASGEGSPENSETLSSIILGTSLLTARGIPVAGEYEVKNAHAMKIMDALGAGGSFSEFYAMDFREDVVLLGHDGPGHLGIAEGRIRVRPLEVYHGKTGKGLSVEMSVKEGPVTLLSVVETGDGKIEFLVAEGETVAGPILEIGNTNSRYRFPPGAKAFVNQWNACGPAHHCAVGVGHVAGMISKLGELLNVTTRQIC